MILQFEDCDAYFFIIGSCKKFIATRYIIEGGGGITTLTKDETDILKQASNVNPAAKKFNGR
jgi:hypothetical protein